MTVSDNDMVIDEQNKYDGKTWWELRPTMVYVPYPAWVKIKTTFIKVCKKKLIQCDEAISSWDRKINAVDEQNSDRFRP